MPNRPGALAAIGNTPIVELSSFGAELELVHSDHGIHPELIPQMTERAADDGAGRRDRC